jgi:hypothetical protein
LGNHEDSFVCRTPTVEPEGRKFKHAFELRVRVVDMCYKSHMCSIVRLFEYLPQRKVRPMSSHHHRQPIRLTRRGRVVMGATVVFAGLGMAGLVNTAVAADQPSTSVVVVQGGESLWSIAQDVQPHADPRAVIHDIKALNGLTTSVVRVGQALTVPLSS